jgi:hypothetical protein
MSVRGASAHVEGGELGHVAEAELVAAVAEQRPAFVATQTRDQEPSVGERRNPLSLEPR